MSFNKRCAWPHPVLTPLSDDIEPNDFDFELEASPEHPDWLISVGAKHGDATIANLVAAGHAAYLLQLECKATFLRRGFIFVQDRFDFRIPSGELTGLVSASFLAVASKDLDAYQHPLQHADYNGSSFQISIGEPLAVAVSKVFDAYLDADPILNLPSIIDIRKGEDASRIMAVTMDAERIIIGLPPDEFEKYKLMRTNLMVRDLLASTIILPAIIQSLHYLRGMDADELEEFKLNHRWARHILNRLEALEINILNTDNSSICLDAAQQLLHAPVRRSLENINKLFSEK
jgi:hypothetical protein